MKHLAIRDCFKKVFFYESSKELLNKNKHLTTQKQRKERKNTQNQQLRKNQEKYTKSTILSEIKL